MSRVLRVIFLCVLPITTVGMGQTCMMVPPTTGPPAGGLSAPLPCSVDLSGRWKDGSGTAVLFAHFPNTNMLTSTFIDPKVCDHRDGLGTTETRMQDFTLTIDDCSFADGRILVCRFGCDNGNCPRSENGATETDFRGTIDPNGLRIDGEWFDFVANVWVPLSYERDCDRQRISATDGALFFQGDATGYDWMATDEDAGVFTIRATGPCGVGAAFNGPEDVGTVIGISSGRLPGETVIEVQLDSGNVIVYRFVPATVFVSVGDTVSMFSTVGVLADPCAGMTVEYRDALGNPVPRACFNILAVSPDDFNP